MAPNRSRLLVLIVGLLLAVAALVQAVGGDSSDPIDGEATSSSSPNDESESGKTPTSVPPTTATSTTVTTSPSPSTTTISVQRPVSVAPIAGGATRITGYGSNVVDMVGKWSDYRTIIYRSPGAGTELRIELQDKDQVPVLVLGYPGQSAPIEGLRFLSEVTQDVQSIAVTAAADWEMVLLPDAFLWNQQIDAGNLPQAGEFMIFSSNGLNFVGSEQNPVAQGIGDLRVYNACHAPCSEEAIRWVFELGPDCSNTPSLSIREVGSDLFQRTISPTKSESDKKIMEVTLENYDWLEVLTPCRWSATPTSN